MELGVTTVKYRRWRLVLASEVPAMEAGFTVEVPAMEAGSIFERSSDGTPASQVKCRRWT